MVCEDIILRLRRQFDSYNFHVGKKGNLLQISGTRTTVQFRTYETLCTCFSYVAPLHRRVDVKSRLFRRALSIN